MPIHVTTRMTVTQSDVDPPVWTCPNCATVNPYSTLEEAKCNGCTGFLAIVFGGGDLQVQLCFGGDREVGAND